MGRTVIFFAFISFIIIISCKSTHNISLKKETPQLTSENSVFVLDIVKETVVLDTVKYNSSSEGLVDELLNSLQKTLLIHDDSRLSKVTFDEGENVIEHWLLNKDSLFIRYYSKTPKGQTNYEDVKIEDLYDVDKIPTLEKAMKDSGVLTIDSTSKVIIAGYDCFKIRIRIDDDSTSEHYFSDEVPRVKLDQGEGIVDIMLNTKFNFSLKHVMSSQKGGFRITEQPKNRRIDETMKKYLTLNLSTYSTIE